MKVLTLITGLLLTVLLSFGQQANETDFDKFSVKVGYSLIQHLEPQIYGQNMNTQQMSTTNGGILSGLETMNGLNVKAYYFLKNNIGIYFDMSLGNSSNSVEYQNDTQPFIQYQSSADFISPSLGIASRFTFGKLPANLIVGTSIGYYGYNMSYSETANGLGQWYNGSYNILKLGLEALIEYEIFKGINLFSEINYSTQLAVDADNIYMEYTSDSGDFYNIVYNSPSMAAIRITIGLGYNF